MTSGSDPLTPQFTDDELRAVVGAAHAAGCQVAAHAHSTEAIRAATAAGVDTIEHCSWRAPDGTLKVAHGSVVEIVERGIHVVLTMAGIQRGLLSDGADHTDALQLVARKNSDTGNLRDDFSWARDMLAAGARLVLASDAGVRLTPFDLFRLTIRCGMEALDLTASQAIGLATLGAAEALGVETAVGSVELGKVADLVALAGVIDDSTTHLGPIRQVWQGGCLVVQDGELII